MIRFDKQWRLDWCWISVCVGLHSFYIFFGSSWSGVLQFVRVVFVVVDVVDDAILYTQSTYTTNWRSLSEHIDYAKWIRFKSNKNLVNMSSSDDIDWIGCRQRRRYETKNEEPKLFMIFCSYNFVYLFHKNLCTFVVDVVCSLEFCHITNIVLNNDHFGRWSYVTQ